MELTGKLLVAMPGMQDARFGHSVVFVCSHSAEGTMGLIINKPVKDMALREVLSHLEIEAVPEMAAEPVFFGGPVEMARGFVLHSDDYASSLQTLKVEGGYAMTATQDILEDIGRGAGPAQVLMMLGYAGWGAGQLAQEILENGWLTVDADPGLVFGGHAEKWQSALSALGVDPLSLSGEAGRA